MLDGSWVRTSTTNLGTRCRGAVHPNLPVRTPTRAARRGGQHWPKATARRRAAVLTAASTAPALPRPGPAFGVDRQRTEGSPPWAQISRRNLVFGWVHLDPDHEACIRFKGEAPGRRAHSADGIHCSHGSSRVTATSDRDQRPCASARPVAEIVPAITPTQAAAARRPPARCRSLPCATERSV